MGLVTEMAHFAKFNTVLAPTKIAPTYGRATYCIKGFLSHVAGNQEHPEKG